MAERIAQPNDEILAALNDYNLFIDSDKSVELPFLVSKEKGNHPSSLYESKDLVSSYPFGQTKLDCEVREKSEFDYSFSILSDRITKRVLFRLDEGDGTHYNRHISVPLNEQQVTTPHFHKYGNDGIMYAYKSILLKQINEPLNIHDAFGIFCDEIHLDGNRKSFEMKEDGVLPNMKESVSDPLKGVDFK